MPSSKSLWLGALPAVVIWVIGVSLEVLPAPHQMDYLKFFFMRQDYTAAKSLHTAAMGSFYDVKV